MVSRFLRMASPTLGKVMLMPNLVRTTFGTTFALP